MTDDPQGFCLRCRITVPLRLEHLPGRCGDPLCPPLVPLDHAAPIERAMIPKRKVKLTTAARLHRDGSFGRKRRHTPLVRFEARSRAKVGDQGTLAEPQDVVRVGDRLVDREHDRGLEFPVGVDGQGDLFTTALGAEFGPGKVIRRQ